MNVVVPAPRTLWRAALGHSETLAFQTPEWLECVCEVGRYRDVSRLYVLDDRPVVLPLVERQRRRRSGAQQEASLPYGWGFGGLVTPDRVTPADVDVVVRDLSSRAEASAAIRPNPVVEPVWESVVGSAVERKARLAHVLKLDGDADVVWRERLKGEARTAVRKAERSSVAVEVGSAELLPDFYALYRRSVIRWARAGGKPRLPAAWRQRRAEPARKYRLVCERLGGACRIWLARVNGRPAAAIVVLTHGENASYWRGAMDENLAGPTRANYLLHWRAIEHAVSSGCRRYHMGETGTSLPGLAQFKTRFGAEPHPYFEYCLGGGEG